MAGEAEVGSEQERLNCGGTRLAWAETATLPAQRSRTELDTLDGPVPLPYSSDAARRGERLREWRFATLFKPPRWRSSPLKRRSGVASPPKATPHPATAPLRHTPPSPPRALHTAAP